MIGDGSYWGIPGWGNAERQYYTQRSENLRVENGELLIEAAFNDPPIIPNQVGAAGCPWQQGCHPGKPFACQRQPARHSAGIAGRSWVQPRMPEGAAPTLSLLPLVATATWQDTPLHSALTLTTTPLLPPPTRHAAVQAYTSARIRTRGKFSVAPTPAFPRVRIEARIRTTPGLCLWPAFWMLPEDAGSSTDTCSGCGAYGGWVGERC